jgi:hypothetical protein
MATKLRIWNRQEFDNQDSKLLLHQHEIQTSENIRRIGILEMMNVLSCKYYDLSSET